MFLIVKLLRVGFGHGRFAGVLFLEVVIDAQLVVLGGLLDQVVVGHRLQRLALEIESFVGDQLIDALLEHRTHLIELRLDLRVEVLLADFVIADGGDHGVRIVGPCAGAAKAVHTNATRGNGGNDAPRGFKANSPWLIRFVQ